LTLLLLACPLSCATAAAASIIRWVDCAQHPPFSPLGASVNLTQLPKGLKCGRINVPMDYSKAMGPGNNITLGLAMVRPPNPKGVIFQLVLLQQALDTI
jgi:hypothetical protein